MDEDEPALALSFDEAQLAAFDELAGRREQMQTLGAWLFPKPVACVLWVWGGPGTGKTSAVERIMAARASQRAYVDCVQHVGAAARSLNTILEAVLNQLADHVPSRDNSWKPWLKVTSPLVFEDGLVKLLDDQGERRVPAAHAAADPVRLYVTLDHADALIRACDKLLVAWLMKLPHDARFSGRVGLVLIARNDWNGCVAAPLDGMHVMELHFDSYSPEVMRDLLSKRDPRKKAKSRFQSSAPHHHEWASTLTQSLHNAVALLGFTNMEALYKDGYNHIGSKPASADVHMATRPFVSAVLAQDSTRLLQVVSEGVAAAGSVAPSPSQPSLDQSRDRKRRPEKIEQDRNERMRLVSEGMQILSQPIHDSALVVAAYLASVVPKSKDAAIFSPETSRTKQRRSASTVGSAAATAVAAKKKTPTHSFKLQRLLGIFQVLCRLVARARAARLPLVQHVIGDYNFVPTSLWFNCVQSLIEAGRISRKGAESRLADVKLILSPATTLDLVRALATEIHYDSLDDVLSAQV